MKLSHDMAPGSIVLPNVRLARFELYAYNGRSLGDAFARTAHEAAHAAGAAYAKPFGAR